MNISNNLREINQIMAQEDLSFIPLFCPEGFKSKNLAGEAIFSKGRNEVEFTAIKGIQIENYVTKDNTKKSITDIFTKLSSLERTYENDLTALRKESAPHSAKLPDLYKKLETEHWLITSVTTEDFAVEFVSEINK